MKHTFTRLAIHCATLALMGVSGAAFADGGAVTGVSVSPNAVFANDITNLKVNITQGSYGTHCKMRWSVRNVANMEVKAGGSTVQSSSDSAEYMVNLVVPTPGIYTVEAMGGSPDSQTTSCMGKVTTSLTIKDKMAISANPGLTVAPAAPAVIPRPATPVVVQLPAAVLVVTALSGIKQVPYTNNGGETWIEVQGTGNCSFTIQSAGVAPASFSSSAAKPFPMKVKIPGAPLGSHLWQAKGTGNCNGSASTTFSVS